MHHAFSQQPHPTLCIADTAISCRSCRVIVCPGSCERAPPCDIPTPGCRSDVRVYMGQLRWQKYQRNIAACGVIVNTQHGWNMAIFLTTILDVGTARCQLSPCQSTCTIEVKVGSAHGARANCTAVPMNLRIPVGTGIQENRGQETGDKGQGTGDREQGKLEGGGQASHFVHKFLGGISRLRTSNG